MGAEGDDDSQKENLESFAYGWWPPKLTDKSVQPWFSEGIYNF